MVEHVRPSFRHTSMRNLRRLARRGKAPAASPRAVTPRPRQPLHFETLEPRILLSADIVGGTVGAYTADPYLTATSADAIADGLGAVTTLLAGLTDDSNEFAAAGAATLPALLDPDPMPVVPDESPSAITFLELSNLSLTGSLADAGGGDNFADLFDAKIRAYFTDIDIEDEIHLDEIESELNALDETFDGDGYSYTFTVANADADLVDVGTDNAGGPGDYELRFSMDVNLTGFTTKPRFDLGRTADSIGLTADNPVVPTLTNVNVSIGTTLHFALSFGVAVDISDETQIIDNPDPDPDTVIPLTGIEATDADFFLDADTAFAVKAFDGTPTTESTLPFDLRLGFLDIQALSVDYQLDATLTADLDSRLTRAQINSINGGGTDIDTVLTMSGSGSFTITMPVKVTAGPTGFTDDFFDINGDSPTLTYSGNPFDPLIRPDGTADPRTAPGFGLSNFEELLWFNNTNNSAVLGQLQQLAGLFGQISASQLLSSLGIPFAGDETLGSAFDLASPLNALVDELLTVPSLPGVTFPQFLTAQAFAAKLGAAMDGDADPHFDPDTGELTFHIAFDLADVGLDATLLEGIPLNFNVDLGALAGIHTDLDLAVTLDPEVGFDFIFGIDLNQDVDLSIATALTQLALAAFVSPSTGSVPTPLSGVLTQTARFSLNIGGQGAINVAVAADPTNLSREDLRADIQTAIDAALTAAGIDDVAIDARLLSGDRLALVSGDTPYLTISDASLDAAETAGGFALLGFTDGQVATRVPTPANGLLSGTASFLMEVGPTSHTINVAQDLANTTIEHLRADVQTAVDGQFGAGIVNVTVNGGSLLFTLVDGSETYLRITDPNAVADQELGIRDEQVAAELRTVGDRQLEIEGSAALPANGVLTDHAGFTLKVDGEAVTVQVYAADQLLLGFGGFQSANGALTADGLVPSFNVPADVAFQLSLGTGASIEVYTVILEAADYVDAAGLAAALNTAFASAVDSNGVGGGLGGGKLVASVDSGGRLVFTPGASAPGGVSARVQIESLGTTQDHTSANQLAGDVNAALARERLADGTRVDTLITAGVIAKNVDGDPELEAVLELSASSAPVDTLQITAGTGALGLAATGVIGVYGPPGDGVLSAAAEFRIRLEEFGGTATIEKTFSLAVDATNTSITDLVEDINVLIGADAQLGGKVVASVVGSRIAFAAVEADAATLEIIPLNAVAGDELGLSDGGLYTSKRDESGSAFIRDASITASLELEVTGGTAPVLEASFGFVGIEVGSITGTVGTNGDKVLEASMGLAFDGDVTLSELASALGQAFKPGGSTAALEALVDVDYGGEAALVLDGVTLRADGLPTGIALDADAALTIAITDLTDVVGTTSVTPTGFGNVLDFIDLTFGDVLDAFESVLDDVFAQMLDSSFLNDPLPVLGITLADGLGVFEHFEAALAELRAIAATPAGLSVVVQDLAALLAQALGVPTSALGLSTDTGSTLLKLELGREFDFEELLPINVDLVQLLNEAGIDPGILGGLVNLAGSAGLDAHFSASASLDFALDVQAPTTIYVYDSTGVAVTASARAQNVAFTGALGPFGIVVDGGSAALDADGRADTAGDATFSAGFDFGDDGLLDDRMTLAALLASIGAELDVELVAAAGAFLPVYFPTASDFAGNLDFTAKFDLSGGPDFTLNSLPDFSRLPDLSDFNVLDSLRLFVEGFDLLLATLDDAVRGQVFGDLELPLIGDTLADIGSFFEDIRQDVLPPLRALLEQDFANPAEIVAAIQDALFDALDPLLDAVIGNASQIGVKLYDADDALITDLLGADPSTIAQIRVDLPFDFMQSLVLPGFDLGLPALGLEFDGSTTLDVSVEFDLGFGVSRDDGFFFAVPVGGLDTLMNIDVALNLPDAITGNLLFLQLTADNLNKVANNNLRNDRGLADLLADIPALTGFFDITINDADGILSFGDIASLDFDFDYGAQADVLLALDLGFNGVSVFPSLVADLDLGWGLADGVDGAHPEIPLLAFNNIGLNLGDFFSDFLGGILGEIQTLTGPIQPLLDILMAPIPVISDLAGEPITLVDIAEIFGDVDLGFIKAAADIITLVNSIPTDADDLVLYFGSFSIGGDGAGSMDLRDPFALDDFRDSGDVGASGQLFDALGDLAPNLAGALADPLPGNADFIGLIGDVLDGSLGGASPGFFFPIINDPGQIFGLLLGRDAVLMTYDMPEFVLGFEYEQFFPIWDAFGVEVGGSVGMTIDLAFGYDTAGIRRFAEGGFDNPLDLMHGFFIADLAIDELGVPSGPDIPEVSFNASLTGAAALNIGVASVSVGGGVFASIGFNLNDPDNDGRVRFAELLGNIESGFDHLGVPLGVIGVFDVHGEVEARLFASLEILFIIDETWYFGPDLPLISFDYSFPRDPILATDVGDGELRLNMGLYAEDRLYGNTTDHSEIFFAKLKAGTDDTVLVWAPDLGVSESEAQEYSGVSLITAKAGFGNDTVDLSGITTTSIEFNLEGGDGDDTFTAGDGAAVFLGQGGNDTLIGGKSKDRLDGDAGNDQLFGNDGDDLLIGGADDDLLDGGDGADLLLGGTGNDEMIGGAGNDRLRGGAGMDTLFGGAGEDVLAGEGDADVIHGGDGDDLISGGGGSDHIYGDSGDDTVWADSVFAFDADNVLLMIDSLPVLLLPTYLTAGHDTVEGGDGDDLIYGEDGNDFLRGNAGDDVIHGQRGADVIYGDDGNDTLFGQQENDVIYGNAGDDFIDGAEGNDILFGDDGEVVYYAVGEAHPLQAARTINPLIGGKDVIQGAIGDDLMFGGADEDTLSGGLGDDVAFGDHGKVEFALINGLMVPFAGAGGGEVLLAVGAFSLMQNVESTDADMGGDDLIYGAEGEDILIGGTADDTIYGQGGDDVLIGDHGQVILVPDGPAKLSRIAIIQSIFPNDGGNDILDGSLNDDVIIGGAGDDIGTGGAGFDVLLGDNGLIRYDLDLYGNLDGLDLIKSGVQVVPFMGGYVEVKNDLADPPTFTFSGKDTLSGGAGDDVIMGGVGNDTLLGDNTPGAAPNAAPGTPVGAPGDDVILGDNGLVRYVRLLGADSLTRIETTDTTQATGGTDIADGNEGNDMILGGVQGDYLRGNEDDDIILGDNGLLRWDVLAAEGIAGAGDADPATLDLITTQDFALGGVDYITGNAGDDLAFGGTAGDQIAGDNNASVLGGVFNQRELNPGADVLIGDQGRIVFLNGLRTRITTTDTAETDGGVDTIQGNDYGDILLGGVQGDFLHGEALLVGGLGVVDLVGTAGDDILLGDEGELRYDVAADEVLFNLRPGVDIRGDGNALTLDRINTFATGTLGGVDMIYGNDGADIAMGGRAGDTIYGDFYAGSLHTAPNPGADMLMGDGGEVHFVGDVRYHFATREPDQGGSDTIYGNDRGDAILGGFAGDFLFGEAAQADLGLIGGRGGADIILGDNGRFDYVLDQDSVAGRPDLPNPILLDPNPVTLDRVMTTNPTLGGNDQIHGNALGDTIFGGTGSDIIWGDTDDAAPNGPDGVDGDDVILGDHGKRYPQKAPDSNFFAIDTQEVDAGAGDLIFGNGAEDRILGQQGDDIVFGGTAADDIIGGHNVLDGHDELDDMDPASQNAILSALLKDHDPSDLNDINDVLDGGAGDDLIAGDNAIVERLADSTNPRFQVLSGGLIYGMETVNLAGLISVDVGFDPLVTGDPQFKPFSAEGRRVVLLNHSEDTAIAAANNPTAPRVFGNDVMAGGSDDDELFGELGDDIAQGDGLIERVSAAETLLAFNPAPSVDPSFTIPDGAGYFTVFGDRLVFRVQEAASDGDDYLEGNGGNDRLYGDLGQDDLIGGSSTLFGLSDATAAIYGVGVGDFARPDGADLLYGGAGNPLRLARLAATDLAGDGAVPADQAHGRDADVLMGDNANVYRLVGKDGTYGYGYLAFNHDVMAGASATDGYSAAERIIARGVELVDYGYGFSFVDGAAVGSFTGVGMGDLIYGEGGDDIAFGMTGDDVIFGGGEDDDLYGGLGADWISGGNGIDGILGDDGLIYTSRNAIGYGEPLYGIAALPAVNVEITTPGNIQREIINIADELKKTANLVAFNLEGDSDPDLLGRMNDILYGGLGTDYLHGGFGDDAMSGAEALPIYFGGGTTINDFLKVQQLAPLNLDPAVAEDPYWYAFAPYNPGDILRFQGNSTEDEFALYDEFFPRRKIMLDETGNAVATAEAGVYDFLLNFNETEGPASFAYSDGSKPTDGDDRMFGDLGNDWMVGGSGRDHMWGGRGNDLLNMDDNHDSGTGGTHPKQPPGDPLDNSQSDEFQAYADIAYGGAGRDVLILNTGADRAIDWVGEYNSYIVPFAPFGAFHISRTLMPQLPEYLYALAVSDGTDTSIPDGARYAEQKTADVRVDDPQDPALAARLGEPFGELGLVLQTDYDWQDQTGAPQDPQPGNLQGPREIMRRELFTDSGAATPFAATVGTFTVTSGKLKAAPLASTAQAVSVYHFDQMQPDYMEILATVNMDKPKSGWNSNSYIIFDYQSPTDFKFAGVDAGLDKVRIGHYTASGWVVDQQVNLQLRDGTNYKLTLVLHGTVASVYVNGATPVSFDFRSALNDGMLGLGTNGAVARFDDFQVQKLPPVLTFDFTETFDTGAAALATSLGNWLTVNGRLEGSPGTADYAFASRFVDVAAASRLELEAALRLTGGSAGVVFDDAGDGVFKFAALLPGTDQVVLGHHTARGFVIDATASYVLNTGTDYTLKVSLIGTGASVSVNGQAVLGFVYNGLLNDGGVGLLARDGTAAFDRFSVRGDDPAYLDSGAGLRAASMGPDAAVAPLAVAQLEAALAEAGERLAAAGWFGLTPLDLRGITVAMDDLPGLRLAEARGQNLIVLDVNAAGHGWFADQTPSDDAEFRLALSGVIGAATGSPAHGRMDLVSALAHELAHLAGAEHARSGGGLMSEVLDAGVRNLPVTGDGPQAAGVLPDWVSGMLATTPAGEVLSGKTPLLVFDAVTGRFGPDRSAAPAPIGQALVEQTKATPVDNETPPPLGAGTGRPEEFPGLQGVSHAPAMPDWPAAIAELFQFPDAYPASDSDVAEAATDETSSAFWGQDEVAGSLLHKLNRSNLLADVPVFTLLV